MIRALVALGLALAATPAAAQTMRTFTTARQQHGDTRLAARLEYAAGTLQVRPAPAGTLYRMQLTFDQDRFAPVGRFDAGTGAVLLGLRATGGTGLKVSSPQQLEQSAVVALSPAVDLSLDAALGAVEARLELGGLRLTGLALTATGSRTEVRFSRPNAARCRLADFRAGAAELTVAGLGNSRCDEIRVEGGVGKVELDFGGTWAGNTRATVKLAMGDLTLRLPRTVGIRLTMDRFLASFQPTGFERRPDGYVTPNWERAERRLEIALTTTIGGVSVEWLD